jgi:DNA invertase Pin-like site-specific DNA recombinase
MTKPLPKRCAIYTRKSSEEGLDQTFNSLDAQREAGEAYVKSQASEGWRTLAPIYDDGGFSGGTMERPGLKRLLADVEAGLIDVVVVYKIDRLTRSLADFARIVEQFDARGVSFVSVTQAFNTTSSMGRLTLNVLLSFAQFEREVTGERIRDKIAASKAKGMWMGGVPPLGYDPVPGARTLSVNTAEAATVRHIFQRYLELGSVHHLQAELANAGIVSKQRMTAAGKIVGGVPLSRGAIFHMLRARIYLGQIPHKTLVHPGQHEAIIDAALFDQVQALLAKGSRRSTTEQRKVAGALLTGRIFDAAGVRMSPAFSYGRGGRVYRYYVSAPLQQGAKVKRDAILRRVSAPAIEALATAAMQRLHPSSGLAALMDVRLQCTAVALTLPASARSYAQEHLAPGEKLAAGRTAKTIVVTLPVTMPLRGGRKSVLAGPNAEAAPDAVLIGALRKAHAMLTSAGDRPTMATAPVSPYERRILRLAFLAPSLQRDILAGRQPRHFNLEYFLRSKIPLRWNDQPEVLGWSAAARPWQEAAHA